MRVVGSEGRAIYVGYTQGEAFSINVRRRLKIAAWVVIALFFGVVLADALGVFSSKPYTAVPHGDHVHYVPDDRDPNVPVNEFPTREPESGQTISPTGEVVTAEGS